MSFELGSGTLHPDSDVLRLEGEIDLARRPLILDEVESRLRRHPRIVIDVSAVTFIDCAGLGTLLQARARAERLGGHLALVGPSVAVSRMLRLTALDGVLPIRPAAPDGRDQMPPASRW